MSNYLTLDQLKEKRGPDGTVIDFSAIGDSELQEMLDRAEEIVETITNDIFYEKTETYRFDGNHRRSLWFPPVVPYALISITSVKEYDFDESTVLYTFTEKDHYLKYPHHLEKTIGWPSDSPRRVVTGGGGVWPKGQRNIWVEGVWGRSSVPADIYEAVQILAAEMAVPGSTGVIRSEVASTSWSDFTITYRGRSEDSSMRNMTGITAVDRMLMRWINRSDLMFLAEGV
jgi:hypothetical protein